MSTSPLWLYNTIALAGLAARAMTTYPCAISRDPLSFTLSNDCVLPLPLWKAGAPAGKTGSLLGKGPEER
ncbi:MAG: hypothetical protein ACRD3S_19920 [Terracidiphilus sp.]